MRLIFLCLGLLFSFHLYANDWTKEFYTDDTEYYQKILSDGFIQRVRIHQRHCSDLNNLEIILKNGRSTSFSKAIKRSDLGWPKLYGLAERDHCFFEATIRGLNLNSPEDIQFIIKIDHKSSDLTYFIGYSESLLPEKRLVKQLSAQTPYLSIGGLGATPVIGGGVFFRIWEPDTEEVHLVLNQKTTQKLNVDYPLKHELRTHSIYLPNAKTGDEYQYKFVKDGKYEVLEVGNNDYMSDIKVDPMARALTYDDKGGRFNGYVNPRAIVKSNASYPFQFDRDLISTSDVDRNNWIIYQLWPLTFNPPKQGGVYKQGTFNSVKERLDYLVDLGINTVELLPVHESRFNASWGYALDSLLLIEKNYGRPEELQSLVDTLHQKRIRVLFDVVLNHLNNHLIRDPLSKYQSSSKFYEGNSPWGPRPRFRSVMVRKWILDSLLYLIRDYHVDGFRFDMTEGVYSGSPHGYLLLQELNHIFKLENPNFYSSAEELPDNVWATYPVAQNGMGFDSQWSDIFKNFFELEFDHYRNNNRIIDLRPIRNALMGFSNHKDGPYDLYHFGPPSRTVNYLGSHDFIGNKNPFIRIISGYRGSERVDHNEFERVSPLEEGRDREEKFRLIHNQFTHATARMAYGILFTKPGATLFYQGEEFAQDLNIQNEWSYVAALEGNAFPSKNVDIHRYVGSHRVPWDFSLPEKASSLGFLTNSEHELFKGHLRYFKDLIAFKNEFPYLNEQNARNVHTSYNDTLLTYELKARSESFYVIVNFGLSKEGVWVSFPGSANDYWKEVVNSSRKTYGNESDRYRNVISHQGGRANHIRLYGPSILVFKREATPAISERLYLRGNFNSWEANESSLLQKEPLPEIYSTTIELIYSGEIEFKVGSSDWSIDLGAPQLMSDTYEAPKFFGQKNSGQLSYRMNLPNQKLFLEAGRYRFRFDLQNFTFVFEKI